MKSVKVNRRKFLKMLGWGGAGTALTGCDMPTTVTLEEGKEDVVSYLIPEEYVIPGIGVWYASTCTQCEAGCGLHGRVREGRILKLEGNPDSPINNGNICMMGQSGVQAHYNPDRITAPMMRKGSSLQTVSWDEALAELNKRIGSVSGKRFAMMTGTISGHQSVLVSDLMAKTGSSNHFVHETVNASVWQAVCRDMLGDDMPHYRFDKAQVVLSFGADFLGTWVSPVHLSGEYAKFRKGKRGVLVTVEPKMTLTGGNSDLWVPANPGTEGALALGIASFVVDRGWNKVDVPAGVKSELAKYSLEKVETITGIEASKIKRIASLLSENSPALVLAGASATNHEHGYEAASAIMLLNILLGAVGTTIQASQKFPEASLQAKQGNTANLLAFAKGLEAKKYDMVVFHNVNPVYTAPKASKLAENLDSVGFKVALSMFPDETTLKADLVLPVSSSMEDWGTHVAAYSNGAPVLSVQQPLMEMLYKDTRSFGDIMLSMLKVRDSSYGQFADYYAYLRTAVKNMPASVTGGANAATDAFWSGLLQKGVLAAKGQSVALNAKLEVPHVSEGGHGSNEFALHLIPSARLGMWDGRHANLPWMQEAPDQISKVVWDSWAELHPHTAGEYGVKSGDIVRITSAEGSIETQVYVHKGVHKHSIAVPLGQGHSDYGRYAKGRGANPLSILSAVTDKKTGELATHATRVKIEKVRKHNVLVRMGGSETQVGRKFVRTISADVIRRTEGEA